MKIEFTKMQGAGNDYIYVNTLIYPLSNPEELAVAWSRPHTGIGSDGLVLIGSSGKADFSMRIFTPTVRKQDVRQRQPLHRKVCVRVRSDP